MHDDRLKLSRRVLLEAVAASALMAPLSSMAAPAIAARFALVARGRPVNILIDEAVDPAIEHVAQSFASDLERVSGTRPTLMRGRPEGAHGALVIIAAKAQSALVERLAAEDKLSVGDLDGQWEAFRRIVLSNPFPGVEQALFIVGSDRRGAVFGTYDLSERMGVSPWHWYADVPVARRRDLTLALPTALDRPKVRYRGFFINDEDPCLSGWAVKKFGGVNSAMYAHVFELLLRMKGNYLWPAMWGKAFALDDPKSMVLADAMGVVMGNSHHEPMHTRFYEWLLLALAAHSQ